MKKKLLAILGIMVSSHAIAMTCPDPSTFVIKPCTPDICTGKYYLETPEGFRPQTVPPFDKEIVFTNNFAFQKASWGGKWNYYPRVVCEYQDPQHAEDPYHLILLSNDDFNSTDFDKHSNWIQVEEAHYECTQGDVAHCAFR